LKGQPRPSDPNSVHNKMSSNRFGEFKIPSDGPSFQSGLSRKPKNLKVGSWRFRTFFCKINLQETYVLLSRVTRFFAYTVIVNFGKFFLFILEIVNDWATFTQYRPGFNFNKKWVGLHFGRFFSQNRPVTRTNSANYINKSCHRLLCVDLTL
jgi:hypothetical protein